MAKVKITISRNTSTGNLCKTCWSFMNKNYDQEVHDVDMIFETQNDSNDFLENHSHDRSIWHDRELDCGFRLCQDHLKQVTEKLEKVSIMVKFDEPFEINYQQIGLLS